MVLLFDSQEKTFLFLIFGILLLIILGVLFYRTKFNLWWVFGLLFGLAGLSVIFIKPGIFNIFAGGLYFLIALTIFYFVHKRKI